MEISGEVCLFTTSLKTAAPKKRRSSISRSKSILFWLHTLCKFLDGKNTKSKDVSISTHIDQDTLDDFSIYASDWRIVVMENGIDVRENHHGREISLENQKKIKKLDDCLPEGTSPVRWSQLPSASESNFPPSHRLLPLLPFLGFFIPALVFVTEKRMRIQLWEGLNWKILRLPI